MTAPLPPHDACFDIGNGIYYYWRRDSVKLAVREALDRAAKKFEKYPGVYANAGGVIRAMIEEYK